jgi:hypothetical protein
VILYRVRERETKGQRAPCMLCSGTPRGEGPVVAALCFGGITVQYSTVRPRSGLSSPLQYHGTARTKSLKKNSLGVRRDRDRTPWDTDPRARAQRSEHTTPKEPLSQEHQGAHTQRLPDSPTPETHQATARPKPSNTITNHAFSPRASAHASPGRRSWLRHPAYGPATPRSAERSSSSSSSLLAPP